MCEMHESQRHTTENVFIPAGISIAFLLLKKYTGWEVLYYLNLLTVTWFFTALTVSILKDVSINRFLDKNRADIIAGIIILGYGILMSIMSIARHNAYSTYMYDLGNMDQAIWNSSKGNFLEVTSIGAPCANVPRTINHLEWIYQVFALVYRFIPDVRVLLISQTLFVCMGLLGIYFLSKNSISSRTLQIVSLGCIALFPTLHFANLFDFHGDLLAFPFLIWMVYFYDIKKNRVLSGFMMVGALACKEYAALPLFFYGIVLIVHYKDWRWGTIVSIVSSVYFLTAFYAVMPWFNKGNQTVIISGIYQLQQGVGLLGLIPAIVKNSGRFTSLIFSMHSFESLFYLLFPTFFFIFKRPVMLLPVVPILIKDLLAGIDIGSHRLALGIPFLFISFIYSLKHIESENCSPGKGSCHNRFRAALISSATFVAAFTYGPTPLGHQFYRGIEKYAKNEKDLARDTMVAMIPENIVVSASGMLAPHCTHRRYCYQFPRPFLGACSAARNVDIIVVDSSDQESRIEDHQSFSMETVPWVKSMKYSLIMERCGVYLFKKSGCDDNR
jgi:uncharacterized membrane protein